VPRHDDIVLRAVAERRHDQGGDRDQRNRRADHRDPGADGRQPGSEPAARQGQDAETDETARRVRDEVGGVEASGRQQMLGSLEHQARAEEHGRQLPPPPQRGQGSEVETEGDEEEDVRHDLFRVARPGVAARHERDQLERARQQGGLADPGFLELPQDDPDQQRQVDHEHRDQQDLRAGPGRSFVGGRH
jgi:hypothetical protein